MQPGLTLILGREKAGVQTENMVSNQSIVKCKSSIESMWTTAATRPTSSIMTAFGVVIEIALAEIVVEDHVIESRVECNGFTNSPMQENLVNESPANDARRRRLQESIYLFSLTKIVTATDFPASSRKWPFSRALMIA
jgi:hypothetical protein